MFARRAAVTHSPDGPVTRLAHGLLLFAPLALIGNFAGALLRYPDIGTAVLFPPYAVLTAALLLTPRRDWVWYILVGAAAHFAAHWPRWSFTWVLFADVADVARALTAALMFLGLFRGRPQFDGIVPLLRFIVSAVVVAPAVGATIGATNVVMHDPRSSFGIIWNAWFLSNALTGLTMLPALYLAAQVKQHWKPEADGSRLIELAAAGALLAASCAAMLLISGGGRWQMALILYAPLPALIWMALRFGVSGASAGLTLAAITAVIGSDRGIGAFAGMAPLENALILQLFVTLASLTVLCIAAVSSARRAVTELHAALLASVDDQVATLDAQGVILEINDSWRRAAVVRGAERRHRGDVGDDYLEACRLEGKRGHAVAACVASGLADVLARAERHFEMEYDVGEEANALRYHVSIQMLDRADGGAIVRRSDVTARHRADREIAQQRRELSHLARVAVLGQLSGALAHELNQPLTSIRSNAETARLLLRKPVPDLAELEAILGDIVNEDQRAAEVIRRLRAMLKRGETRLQQLDLPDLVREVMVLANAELLTRRVSANVILGRELPMVLGDRVQLQQVLLNLILNACEAMGGQPPSERSLTLAVATTATDSVQISIRDNGTGIAPMLMQRLFEPFVTNKPEGLGLGLSISRSIVASHGGRLWAENNPNGGATVHCLLRSAKSRPSGPWRIDSAMVAVKV